MTDQKSGPAQQRRAARHRHPRAGLLMDAVILRGAITGFLARPSAKTSIGKVFQERAARYADRVFIKFGDEQMTYREANETATGTPRCWPRVASATATSSASCCATRRNRCC